MKPVSVRWTVAALVILVFAIAFFTSADFSASVLRSVRGKTSLIALVIENSHQAREYQQGFREALMIQEYPVEGLISRFVLLYDHNALPEVAGPVRSLRPYFVDGAYPWSHAFLFAGGSPEAFERAALQKDLRAINGLAYGKEFYRTDAPAPHNLFVSGDDMKELAKDTSYAVRWPPYPVRASIPGTGAEHITVNFHSTLYNVEYTYNRLRDAYTRKDGQWETSTMPINVVFLEAPITGTGEHGRLTIPLQEGKLLLFRSGTVEQGTWKKQGVSGPFQFLTESGDKLALSAGQTWLTVTPSLERVTWE